MSEDKTLPEEKPARFSRWISAFFFGSMGALSVAVFPSMVQTTDKAVRTIPMRFWMELQMVAACVFVPLLAWALLSTACDRLFGGNK